MNNQVLFIMGRATDSAQELTTKNGKDFTKFSVAVNDYKGKDIGSIAHFMTWYVLTGSLKLHLDMSIKVMSSSCRASQKYRHTNLSLVN